MIQSGISFFLASSLLTAQPAFPGCQIHVGVPPDVEMTIYDGTLHIVDDGTVISSTEIRGNVVIDADNVSLTNVRVVSTTDGSALRIKDGADGFTLTDSEIDGKGSTANAIDGYGTFRRNDIHGAENGFNVTGPSRIEGNHIHGLKNSNGAPHYDGIQVDGGNDVQIIGNTIVNENTQTAAVMLDNYFQGLSNVTVSGNLLYGGGYTLYIDGRFDGGDVDDASISITNNKVGGGYYGDYAFYGHEPVFSGNVHIDAAGLKAEGCGLSQ